jgi:hypothetical protein
MNIGQWVVIGLCAFLFIWYLGWNMFNRRRGIATYYWLRRFLSRIGEISQAGWLGASSSGARLGVEHGKKPFRKVEATYWLESRELFPLWIIHLLQGRKEVAMIRASLQPAPKHPFEVGKSGDRGFNRLMLQRGFTVGNEPFVERYQAAWPTGMTPPDTTTLKVFLNANQGIIRRISIRKDSPHLEIHVEIKPLLALSPDAFFESLQFWLCTPGG